MAFHSNFNKPDSHRPPPMIVPLETTGIAVTPGRETKKGGQHDTWWTKTRYNTLTKSKKSNHLHYATITQSTQHSNGIADFGIITTRLRQVMRQKETHAPSPKAAILDEKQ